MNVFWYGLAKEKVEGKGKSSKTRSILWKSPLLKKKTSNFPSQTSTDVVVGNTEIDAVIPVIIRAPLKDFLVIKQEWAATRIQTAFRAFLARCTLRALKSVVKVQARVRGWIVRKQLAIAIKSIESVVRVQAYVKALHLNKSLRVQSKPEEERIITRERKVFDRELFEEIDEMCCELPPSLSVPLAKLNSALSKLQTRDFTNNFQEGLPQVGSNNSCVGNLTKENAETNIKRCYLETGSKLVSPRGTTGNLNDYRSRKLVNSNIAKLGTESLHGWSSRVAINLNRTDSRWEYVDKDCCRKICDGNGLSEIQPPRRTLLEEFNRVGPRWVGG